MDRVKRPTKFTIALAALVLLVAVCIGILVLFRSGLLQRDAQAHGATVLQGAGLDGGPLQNVSALDEGGTSQGLGPLEGVGPLQGGGPLLGAGPLQGNAPIFASTPVGVSDPIPGPNGPPLLPVGPAMWPPLVLPTMPIFGPGAAQLPSDPTPPGDPDPSQQPQTACVTCFIPPPPPAPTPPPNNIVNCANVTCN